MPTLKRVLGTSSIPMIPSSISRSPSGASPRGHTPPHTSPSCLGGEAQLPDIPKIWRKAGSGARHMVQYVSRKGTMIIPFHLPHNLSVDCIGVGHRLVFLRPAKAALFRSGTIAKSGGRA